LGHRSAPSTATRRAATSRRRSLAPARPAVGAQIDNQAINTVMVSKFTQGGEKLDDVIKWAENDLKEPCAPDAFSLRDPSTDLRSAATCDKAAATFAQL
jgi:hypothetical protein